LVNDKASIIDDESERQLFVRSENIRTNARFDEQMSGSPILAVVAYDTERKRVFQYGVGCGIVYESHDPSNPIGSGADAAGLRMIRKLPGVNVDRLTSADMLFFLTTAFCESTTNVGVGGSPSSGEVDKDGARIVDHKVCIAVSNVCGSYLADECSRLTLRKTRQLVKGIGKGDKKAISEAATLLDMSEDRLQNMYVLPSTWTEMANRKLYC
jgi:hypothetical protein